MLPEANDLLIRDMTRSLQCRAGYLTAADQSKLLEAHRDRAQAPLSYYAKLCLQIRGMSPPAGTSDEEILALAFEMDGPARVSASGGYVPHARPGSFPNLLSNLASKILDAALELNEPTYEQWTGVYPGDLRDFTPAPIVAKSTADELDEVLDGEPSQELAYAEEMLSYMLIRRFSNQFAFTPAMAAADDLGAFADGLLGLESAWQNTVNRLCLNLLTGNAPLLDTFNLFDDTNHHNDLASGAAPSVDEWEAMDLKVASQRGIGGTGYVRSPLKVALVPPAHWVKALQTFAPLQTAHSLERDRLPAIFGEMKVPTTDANINVYRGAATVVREPELQAVSSKVWYGLCNPQSFATAAIIRAYQRGWGPKGRRQSFYDPRTKCWHYELEGRVGGAVKQYRTIVRNPGQ